MLTVLYRFLHLLTELVTVTASALRDRGGLDAGHHVRQALAAVQAHLRVFVGARPRARLRAEAFPGVGSLANPGNPSLKRSEEDYLAL